jgi:uncharacterized protein YbjT (DUF2867 family)
VNCVLVTGATGNVGSHLVHLLRERGVLVRVFVRDRDRATAMFAPGDDLDIAVGDFADPASVRAAMDGADQVFLACANHPQQEAWETAVIDAAADAGVRRIVKLSALGARIGAPVAFGDAHARIAEHLRARGIAHVLLEPGFSMANLLGAGESVRQTGAIFLPAQGARVAMIDPRDVAEVSATILAGHGHGHGRDHDGRTYVLTGPQAVTFDDVARELSTVLGRRIDFVPVTDEAALGQLVEAGVPEWFATNMVTIFGFLRQGAQSEARDVVRTLTGREPRPVGEFLRDRAAAFGERVSSGRV